MAYCRLGKLMKPVRSMAVVLGCAVILLSHSAQAAVAKPTASLPDTVSLEAVALDLIGDYMASWIYPAVALPLDMMESGTTMASTLPVTAKASASPVMDETGAEDALPVELQDLPAEQLGQALRFGKPIQGATMTSGFGARWGHQHKGIDFGARIGTPILSAEDGKVAFSGWQSGYGQVVIVNHGGGYATRYAHASKLLVRAGQMVQKGQTIAKVGNTGRSTGPHLHFEVLANGVARNPVNYINQTLAIAAPVRQAAPQLAAQLALPLPVAETR